MACNEGGVKTPQRNATPTIRTLIANDIDGVGDFDVPPPLDGGVAPTTLATGLFFLFAAMVSRILRLTARFGCGWI